MNSSSNFDGPILIVAAHPDDETLGMGIQISRWDPSRITIVHATDGSPRHLPDFHDAGFETAEDYAHQRRRELYQALELVKIRPDQCITFKYPDQEAYLHLADLAGRLKVLIHDLKPDRIYTHPYEGGHPDHDSVAFAVAQACAEDKVYEFTSYHRGGNGFETGRFLQSNETETIEPTAEERQLKQKMLQCFRTQQKVLGLFPVGAEQFRAAPSYDFANPPHEGTLHYETLGWPLTGVEWRRNASEALQLLEQRRTL